MTSIDQARTEVQRAMRTVVAIADRGTPTAAAQVEQELWSAMLDLGRTLMALYFARQAARWTGRSYRVLSENSIGRVMRRPADSGAVRRRGVRGVGSLPCLSAREATG